MLSPLFFPPLRQLDTLQSSFYTTCPLRISGTHSMRPSTAATWQEQLAASTKSLAQDTEATLDRTTKAAEIWRKLRLKECDENMLAAVEMGQQAIEALDSRVQAYHDALLEVQELQHNWSPGLKQKNEDLHTLETRYQSLQANIESAVERIADLEDQTGHAQTDLNGVQADLLMHQVHLNNSRQVAAALDRSNKESMIKVLKDRFEELEMKEGVIRDCFREQDKRQSELACISAAQNKRDVDLTEREATATRIAWENDRDRTALNDALASLRPITMLLGRDDNTANTVTVEAKAIAEMVVTESHHLNEQIDQEKETVRELSEAVEIARNTCHEYRIQNKTMQRDVVCMERAIEGYLQTIAEKDSQINRHLDTLRNQEVERDALGDGMRDLDSGNAAHTREVKQ